PETPPLEEPTDNSSQTPETPPLEEPTDSSSQIPETPPLEEPTDNSSQTPETPSLEGEALVGYYDMFLGQGNPDQVPPIVTAGFDPVNIFDLSPAELSSIDVLFVQNPDNGSFGPEYLANLSNIETAVENGLSLIIHDRFVEEAESILPGGENFDIRRDFTDDADIDVRNPDSLLIEGAGGVITDTTLDGGTSSSHGFAVEGSLPDDADLALSRSNPSEIVTFSYGFGDGHAIYSSIPLDFYLAGFGPPDVSANFREIYAPNVVEYGVELIGPSEEIQNGSFETGDFRGWRTIGNNSIETDDFGSGPTQGEFQALISNAASRTDSPVVDSELEEFLDLAPGVLDGLSNGDVTEGSAIKQTFTAEAGDILRFDWNFLTNEATPEGTFNDFAFFSLTPLTLELADTGESFVSSLTPFSQETEFQTESIAISEAGTYSLGFGVVDVEDDIIDSGLLIDNVRIGDIEPNDTIPEATPTDLVGEGEFNISTEIGDNPNVLPENDVDLFELELDSGDQLIADIDASDIGSELDPILSVFDSSGFLVAQNDDFESLDSFIDFTAEFSDTYYVGVSSFANFDYDPFVEGSGVGGSSGFYDLSLTVNDDGGEDTEYDIDVIFIDDSLNPDQQEVFEDAASRWEEIITGDVPDVVVPGFGFVDDIAIDASAPFIDGPGGILGQAGPTVLRAGSFLPARGIMQFDSADLEFLEEEGLFDDVILHEMAHVIGFGTIWQEKNLLTGIGTPDPRFVGEGATDEYNDIFGVSESGVPVEADFGPGTALSHWDEDLFGNELMTGFINFGENPLSRITAASMGDLDYEVNVDAADAYTPPGIGVSPGEIVGRILAMEDLERTFVKPGVVGHDIALDIEPKFV
nr:pre-peptidase C-terminal domain-containing protein [Xenococcaceae cyanobacterium MO_234.B1]